MASQTITQDDPIFPVPKHIAENAKCTNEQYLAMYKHSIEDPEGFWGEHGKRLDWFKPYTKVKNTIFSKDQVDIRWFEDGVLNVSYNCIDRHLPDKANDVAIIFEGDNPSDHYSLTYAQLADHVGRMANVMKKLVV
ncbi:MAG: acetyl-coenzyme A synthetase N-terminal domain-containing protein, partial [Pseudomonadota bacterium]